MDIDDPIPTADSGQSLLVMVANNTANLHRNSIELKELLVALQQQVNDLSEQVILLQAQVSDLSGQLVVERQSKVHTSPSHASLQLAEEDGERSRKSPKQPRVRYYRHDSGPPGLGSVKLGTGVGVSASGGSAEQTMAMAD